MQAFQGAFSAFSEPPITLAPYRVLSSPSFLSLDPPFSNSSNPTDVILDVQITVPEASARSEFGGRLTKVVETLVAKKEGGLLTALAFESVDDEAGLRLFVRFKGEDGLDWWQGSHEVHEFRDSVVNGGGNVVRNLYAATGKGWIVK